MNRFKPYILLIVMALTYFGSFAQAQADSVLVEYLKIAAKNNPGVQASFNQYLAALEKVPQVGALPDPQASIDFFIKPMGLLGGNQVGNISLMQMFPWFGTLKSAKDEASLMAKARFEQFQANKAELFMNVKTSWYKLYEYEQQIKLIDENITLLESFEKIALIKFQSPSGNSSSSGSNSNSSMQKPSSATKNSIGMGGMNQSASQNPQPSAPKMSSGSSGGMASKQGGLPDVLRVRMEILDQKIRLEQLKDSKKTEEANFNSLLNREQTEEIEVADSLTIETLSTPILAVADSILSNNPMLSMLDAEGQSYAAMSEKAKKIGLPMVGLGVNYMVVQKRAGNSSMMNGNDMVMPMLNFTIPIYRKKYNAMQNEAKLLQESSLQASEELKNKLLVQYRQLVQDLNDASRRIELFKEQSDLANRTTNLLIADYTSNSADYEEVLRMQYKVLDYGFRYIQAITDYNTTVAKAEKLMNSVHY